MIHKASNKLQLKAGTGSVDPQIIESAQEIIANNDIDFVPMGREYLSTISKTLKALDAKKIEMDAAHVKLTKSVMELKANSKIFGYGLIGDMSNILLNLIEENEHIDQDLISLILAHYKTTIVIFNKSMTGSGGKTGEIILSEFQAACSRYRNRH